MRILILSQYYPPEPVSKPAQIAAAMRMRSHIVDVLTGYPNYPTGKLYPGFRIRLFRRASTPEGAVVRCILYPYHGRSVARRCANYGSFLVSAVLGSITTASCDVIYVRHPPTTVGVAAWIISLIKRAPFVYEVTDIWPESGVWSGMMRAGNFYSLLARLERFLYMRAHTVTVVSERARDVLRSKGVPTERIVIGPHAVEELWFSEPAKLDVDRLRGSLQLGSRFTTIFAGNLGLVQGLDTLIEAAAALDPKKFVFLVVGTGTDHARLAAAVKSQRLSHVRFLGLKTALETRRLLGCADAALVHLRKGSVDTAAIPAKTLTYMAAGLPIVAGVTGACAELIESVGAGAVVSPDDPSALARAIEDFAALGPEQRKVIGDRGRAYAGTYHSIRAIGEVYEGLFRNAAESTS